MDSQAIDIRWIPLAKAAAIALGQQITFIYHHIERIQAKRDRYAHNSLQWAQTNVELTCWWQTYDILRAVQNGKTVQPS